MSGPDASQDAPLFEAANLSLSFGGIRALRDVSFAIRAGEVFSIVGPNGAGKTTLFNLISRFYDAESGSMTFAGQELGAVPAHRIAGLGIARTFQNTELFERETVLANLLIARHVHRRTRLPGELLFLPAVRRQELAFRARVEDVIDLMDLQRYRDQIVGNLPYGARKMVEIARALCLEPKLLLLDEPSSGLNPEETEDLSFWIEDIVADLGITVAMVEHDMNLVATVSDRVLALADGAMLATGTPEEVREPSRRAARLPGGPAVDLLTLRNVETWYGPTPAIRGVSLRVAEHGIVTLLGANGAGKTTVLKTISGAMQPQKGSVQLAGRDITGRDPDRVARLGVGHVPEGREVFPFLSVEDNLMTGAFTRRDGGVGADLEMVYGYFPSLAEQRRLPAGFLSGGQQQMLVIGRALMLRPRLMLLDEPSLGLSPRLVAEIAGIVERLNRERRVTILLVEQNARMALDVADYGYVMELGRIVMEDTCERLAGASDIQEFYLGMKDEGARGRRRWKRRKTWR